MSDGVTKYGFQWGPIVVERACADGRYHTILVKTKKHWIDISVSPSGQNVYINKKAAPTTPKVTP